MQRKVSVGHPRFVRNVRETAFCLNSYSIKFLCLQTFVNKYNSSRATFCSTKSRSPTAYTLVNAQFQLFNIIFCHFVAVFNSIRSNNLSSDALCVTLHSTSFLPLPPPLVGAFSSLNLLRIVCGILQYGYSFLFA